MGPVTPSKSTTSNLIHARSFRKKLSSQITLFLIKIRDRNSQLIQQRRQQNYTFKPVVVAVFDKGIWEGHPKLNDFIFCDKSRWEKQGKIDVSSNIEY